MLIWWLTPLSNAKIVFCALHVHMSWLAIGVLLWKMWNWSVNVKLLHPNTFNWPRRSIRLRKEHPSVSSAWKSKRDKWGWSVSVMSSSSIAQNVHHNRIQSSGKSMVYRCAWKKAPFLPFVLRPRIFILIQQVLDRRLTSLPGISIRHRQTTEWSEHWRRRVTRKKFSMEFLFRSIRSISSTLVIARKPELISIRCKFLPSMISTSSSTTILIWNEHRCNSNRTRYLKICLSYSLSLSFGACTRCVSIGISTLNKMNEVKESRRSKREHAQHRRTSELLDRLKRIHQTSKEWIIGQAMNKFFSRYPLIFVDI